MKKIGNLVASCPVDGPNTKPIYVRIGTVYDTEKTDYVVNLQISLSALPLPHMQWNGWCYIFSNDMDSQGGKGRIEEQRNNEFAPKPKRDKKMKGDTNDYPF